LWDTYRAAHPLRTIIEPEKESHMVNSYIRMSEQMEDYWMPTFPEVVGDVRGMNSNHGVAVVADCYAKGVRGFDLEKAYRACKGAITEKTLAPWSAKKKGELDEFFRQEGYFPALATGEEETVRFHTAVVFAVQFTVSVNVPSRPAFKVPSFFKKKSASL
jgi:putative alpha-1,2-mannosidase